MFARDSLALLGSGMYVSTPTGCGYNFKPVLIELVIWLLGLGEAAELLQK